MPSGVLPAGPVAPRPSVTAAFTLQGLEIHTTSSCLHFVSRVGTQVRALHLSQLPSPMVLFTCQPSPVRVHPSEPHLQHQVPTDPQLQVLPGDEIVQVNEQVVVREGTGTVGGRGSRVEPWLVGGEVPFLRETRVVSCLPGGQPAHMGPRGSRRLPGGGRVEADREAERVI